MNKESYFKDNTTKWHVNADCNDRLHLHGGAFYHEIDAKKMLPGIPKIFMRIQRCGYAGALLKKSFLNIHRLCQILNFSEAVFCPFHFLNPKMPLFWFLFLVGVKRKIY